MVNIKIKIDETRMKKLYNAPNILGKVLKRSFEKSKFAVLNEAKDSNFQFKTPRHQRTGWLERSYKSGITTFSDRVSIRPVAVYAETVAENNSFTKRIQKKAEPNINDIFKNEFTNFAKDI